MSGMQERNQWSGRSMYPLRLSVTFLQRRIIREIIQMIKCFLIIVHQIIREPIMNRYVNKEVKAVWGFGALSVPLFWLLSFYRYVKMKRKNVMVIATCIFFYMINKCILTCCFSYHSILSLFFHCYLNDVLCGILFPAYCNLLLENRYACFKSDLWKIWTVIVLLRYFLGIWCSFLCSLFDQWPMGYHCLYEWRSYILAFDYIYAAKSVFK